MRTYFLDNFLHLRFVSILPSYRRLLLPVMLCVLLAMPETSQLTVSVLSDAFWQVAVFVAVTLSAYHLFGDRVCHTTATSKDSPSSFNEVVIASFMGVLPGCGGAIIVITQYVSGRMSFGAVTAVLTSTMGDAAFLLLAANPVTGFSVLGLCLAVGVLSGAAVNKIHGRDFLRSSISNIVLSKETSADPKNIPRRVKWQGTLWQWLMLPGAIIGFMMAAQVDIAAHLAISEDIFPLVGACFCLICIFLWAGTREISNFESLVAEDKKAQQNKVFQKVALDTNFVTSWVVIAFLCFELITLFGGFDLNTIFQNFGVYTPLIAVVVGMIPGCGPQILTTSLYISGAIPLSAQIGNAISNDGDALFPAIALSPKVAIIATLYSSIPALLAAYSYYWLFE